MRLHRRPTRWLCCWLTALLLFMQLATSAYACPMELKAAQPAGAMADMPGCPGHMASVMDPDQPQLCQAHCQQGSQNVHTTPAPDVSAMPLLLAVLDWKQVSLLPAPTAARSVALTSGASPPGSPPLYLCLLVLRN
jgi:hypothetical protein